MGYSVPKKPFNLPSFLGETHVRGRGVSWARRGAAAPPRPASEAAEPAAVAEPAAETAAPVVNSDADN